MKIVLNKSFGGFSLSQEAMIWLKEVKGWKVTNFNKEHYPVDRKADLIHKPIGSRYGRVEEGYSLNWFNSDREWTNEELRTNGDIIEVVITLKEKSSGSGSWLVIEEIDKSRQWRIKNFDGKESIRYMEFRCND